MTENIPFYISAEYIACISVFFSSFHNILYNCISYLSHSYGNAIKHLSFIKTENEHIMAHKNSFLLNSIVIQLELIYHMTYDKFNLSLSSAMIERNNSMKKDYLWNTMAGLINASEAVIMSMIITRMTNLTDAGYVTIAFAVGNLLLTIGKYGIYSFQVTDHNKEYSFTTYFHVRILTTIAMIVCLIGYLIYGLVYLTYSHHKMLIILFIGLIYVVESFEDLIKAQLQYTGLLYIGAIMFIIRWITILLSFGISLYITGSTSTSLGISFTISVFVFIICCLYVRSLLDYEVKKREKKQINLLITCFPLFFSLFLSFYIVNSSKYAIERYMDANSQACFGFVAMPVFAIELLNSFIYQPQLISMTSDFNNTRIDVFKTRIKKQYAIIAFLTAACIGLAYLIGIPALSLLYHTDLSNYLSELLILLLGGGFLALSGYQGVVLTIMRKQKYQLYGYIPVAILAFLFVGSVVKKLGTIGAALSYLILVIILCILYELLIRHALNRNSKIAQLY